MRRKRDIPFYLSLSAGLFIVAISIYGSVLLRGRPALPPDIRGEDLVRIDDVEIKKAKDIEFALIRRNIGDWATVTASRDGQTEIRRRRIIAFYRSASFPLIYLLVGLFSFLIGFSIFVLKSEDRKARLLYWLALAFAFTFIINGGTYCLRKEWPSCLPAALFYLFYPLAPALLVHFSLAFSPRRRRFPAVLIYGPAAAFTAVFIPMVLLSALKSSQESFRFYTSVFSIFRVYIILFLLLAIFLFVYAYRKALLQENKAQIKWIFLGLVLGLGPFIFVYQIPVILKVKSLLTEDLASISFVFIPLGFALSIFKFRLLDVELVINRSLVYSLLTIFTVTLYLFFVRAFQDLFSRLLPVRETIISLGSAVLAAMAFHPARKKIQELVDRAFYRQAYDYRKAIRGFSEMAQRSLRPDELFNSLMMSLERSIPLEKISVAVYSPGPPSNRPLFSGGSVVAPELPSSFGFPSARILARRGATATEEGLDFSKDSSLSKRKLDLVFPFPFKSTSLNGYLALGRKKSGERYAREDLDLLVTLVDELSLNLERIQLCEEVAYEKASREKLDELNRLKTEFISTVSHELRTPMGSIQGLAEILQEGKIKDKARREELLAIVASESGRLSRLVHNILDFGKIEQQTKTYHVQRTEVGTLIKEAVSVSRYSLNAGAFTFRLNLPPEPVFLDLDRDAVKQALINLIDNAIKYSSENREIEIILQDRGKETEIQVKDQGIGVPIEDQDRIFDRFYRAPGAREMNPKGVGLGLKIVKHIMTGHRGYIRVESRPGQGSTFSLVFRKP
jgi:signal transduction histidine kinase